MTGDVIHSTQYYYLGQFTVQTIATWQANSSMENTPMAIKHFFPSQLTLFQSPPTWFQYVSVFSSKNVEQGHKLKLTYLYACWIMYMRHHLQKMECKRWPEMPLILRRSGTQNVAMVTKLLSSNCRTHLEESYCKESNISDTNWSYLIIFDQFGWVYDLITWLICIF